jgi:hypothetical protein
MLVSSLAYSSTTKMEILLRNVVLPSADHTVLYPRIQNVCENLKSKKACFSLQAKITRILANCPRLSNNENYKFAKLKI